MIDGRLAKHGYTVDWGFFSGICVGAENKPLEIEATLTHKIIAELREITAPKADLLAAELEAGTVEPKWFKNSIHTHWKDVDCKREELSDYDAKRIIAGAIHRAKNNAAMARAHATMLEKLIVARHGKPLMPVAPAKKELAVGMKVRVHSIVAEVVELRYQEARGCGPYMNGKHMLHAILKRENGNLFAVPTRSIRQAAILEGGAQ
jgi:hypothetical protein